MSRVSGDGFSVNTDSLRDDATKWAQQAFALAEGRQAVQNSCGLRVSGGNEILTAALELVRQYVQFCSDGEEEFFSTEESLLVAANEYEDTESEIFKKG